MPSTKTLLLALALSTPALTACGPEADEKEEEEEVELFERRRDTCELRCEVLLDPECGAEQLAFDDTEGCLMHCMSEEARNWSLQDDGSDACSNEMAEFYACAHADTCEARYIITNTPGLISQTNCEEELSTLFDCNEDNTE